MQANRETLRRLIAAAVCDLMQFLDASDAPLVVGGSYPRDRLLDQFNKWCRNRNFNTDTPDIEGWLTACESGSLKTPGSLPADPLPADPPPADLPPADLPPTEGETDGKV